MGDEFFARWHFFTDEDPSHGAVSYVDRATAQSTGLASASPERLLLSVGRMPASAGSSRKPSVRVQSEETFNGGLFVLRADHVPTGCGTWPAFWMYGEDALHSWPKWGEYDIIEGVHNQSSVLTSLHTEPHCEQSTVRATKDFIGEWAVGAAGNAAVNCHNLAPDQFDNQGCSQRGPEASLGAKFNDAGGGTWAAEWDPEAGHIRTWFWPVGFEPAELASRRPTPETWGTPYSFFSLSPRTCAPDHFRNMRLVLNINLCGDFGDDEWERLCPELAGQGMSCSQAVESRPELLDEAFWSIRAFDVYHRRLGPPVPPPTPPPTDASKKRAGLVLGILALAFLVIAGALCLAAWRWQRGPSWLCDQGPPSSSPRFHALATCPETDDPDGGGAWPAPARTSLHGLGASAWIWMLGRFGESSPGLPGVRRPSGGRRGAHHRIYFQVSPQSPPLLV